MIRDPRVAFDQLFGAGGTAEDRASRRRTNRSILDWIAEDVVSLRGQLGTIDRPRLDQYLYSLSPSRSSSAPASS